MIGSITIKCNAAKPNFPLQPMFAFMGSPSSLRILEVPKKIGNWNITSVRVVAQYPDNTTIEKVAVRNGAVWVATFDGCDVAGKVGNGLSILADGIDEDGNEVTGYVLGKGDLFILENDTEIARLVEKHTVVYMDELPSTPSVGDLLNSNGEFRIFDGENWIAIGGGDVNDSQITINKNGQYVGAFTTNSEVPVSIDIPVPSRTSDVVNDSGFITASAIPSKVSSFENDVGYITASAIPSNVSEFNNDVGYITSEAIPSEISAFENDVGYITATAIPSQVSSFENDVGYITASALPTKVSELENDSGYITENAIPSTVGAFQNDVGYLTSVSWGEVQNKPDVALMSDIPSKVSELDNDEGFITAEALPSKVSELENDVGYLSAVSWDIVTDKPAIPSKTSDLTNDSGFITESAIPSNVSAFNNDAGYITASALPSKVSELENDSGFITASAIPSNVGAFTNDVGYLTSTSSAFTAKRDKSDLAYKVGFDKNNLDKVVKFVVEYVDGNNQNATATLDKYDEFTQTWTGDNTNWKVYTSIVGMESELYFSLNDGTSGADDQPVPSQGAEDTSWNFTYNSNPATWTMVMTQNIALQQDFKNLRNMKDISYPASVDSTGMYTIQKFNVNGKDVAHFTASGSTSTWDTNDPVVNQYEISTTNGTNFTLLSNGIQLGTFTMSNLKNGVVDVTYDGSTYTVGAVFKQTTFALKDYVDAQVASIPSATSDLVNDSGFITASAISGKRDYTDLSYNKYDTSDIKYKGITSWEIRGLKIGSQTYNFTTSNRGTGHPTYGTYWNNGAAVVYTRNLNTFFFANGGDALTSFTLSLSRFDYTRTWEDSSGVQNVTFHANTDFLARKSELPTNVSELENDVGYITASAIPSTVGAFQNDVGYLTASSSSFTNKRDYDDLTYPGTVYPSGTHGIRQFDLNIEGGHNPSRYTLNKFSTNVPNYGSMWANDEEYWNFAVATSNGEDFTFNKYGEGGEVATFTMSDVTAGAITFTMTDDEIEYTCHLSASMYETTLALKDYVDATVPSNTITISGTYADLTPFSYSVYTA